MTQEKTSGHKGPQIETIVRIGLDTMLILANRFHQEMGEEFDRVWTRCLSELEGFNREVFSDLHLDSENLDLNVTILKSRYRERAGTKNEDMMIEGFLEIMSKVTTSVRNYLGEGPVREAAQEAVEKLSILEKYQPDSTITQTLIAGLSRSLSPNP
jgi:hypothetical protein